MRQIINKYPVILYCLLAYTITWGLKYTYSLLIVGNEKPVFNFSLIAQFGPFIAALLLIAITDGTNGINKIFKSMLKWKVGFGWIFLAFIFEFAMFLSYTLFYWLKYRAFPIEAGFIFPISIFSVITTFILGLFRWGVSEEIGWRGWMLPKLQEKMPPFYAAIISGIAATLWHLNPDSLFSELLVFKEGTYIWGYFSVVVERLVISIPITLVIVYIFNNTKGSLLVMMIFHSASNTSYFWVKETFGIVETDFFKTCFSITLILIAVVFSVLVLKQKKKVTF